MTKEGLEYGQGNNRTSQAKGKKRKIAQSNSFEALNNKPFTLLDQIPNSEDRNVWGLCQAAKEQGPEKSSMSGDEYDAQDRDEDALISWLEEVVPPLINEPVAPAPDHSPQLERERSFDPDDPRGYAPFLKPTLDIYSFKSADGIPGDSLTVWLDNLEKETREEIAKTEQSGQSKKRKHSL